uniref:Uncharacterized protein n=1 Tax=Vespula pensylvanica TaxID=30213 RepID=A0A834PC86_VESPE|nr:hypothetical protein H0235_003479 [Vespula pensylvanica]
MVGELKRRGYSSFSRRAQISVLLSEVAIRSATALGTGLKFALTVLGFVEEVNVPGMVTQTLSATTPTSIGNYGNERGYSRVDSTEKGFEMVEGRDEEKREKDQESD